jgi:hypothetical protein
MKLLLNEQEITPSLPESATLGSALLAAEEQINEDEVIATIHVDGEPLTAELLSEWKNRPVEDFCETRIEAPKRQLLATQGLRLLAQGLVESNTDRLEITEHLCQGRPAEAMHLLPEYLKIWHATPQSLASAARLLHVDLDAQEIYNPQDDQPIRIADAIAQLTEQLAQVKAALEAQDLVMLSDILDYEFSPLTELWQNLLEQFADRFDNLN